MLRQVTADAVKLTLTGYKVGSAESTSSGGILASLSQAGTSCNAFGNDIADLVLSVEYESQTRLHVHIYDKAKQQYQLPDSVFARPGGQSFEGESDLCFNYTSSPFEFWVSRKGSDEVLFDTRQDKIPKRTEDVDIEGKKSNTTILPGYPLVFEDQYLQIASALPSGANIYGLGEVLVSSPCVYLFRLRIGFIWVPAERIRHGSDHVGERRRRPYRREHV